MEISLGWGGLLLVQITLFVMYYGFNVSIPMWLLWLPCIIAGVILFIVLLVIAIILTIAELGG